MTAPLTWPDPLAPADGSYAQSLLVRYWTELAKLPDLLERHEHLLAERLTATLRDIVLQMMLAMNGIAYPEGTVHLNGYLSASQRAVLERTLVAPTLATDTWLARAVGLTVIYRWYAPQIAARFGGEEPEALADDVLATLAARLPDWPLSIETG
jgi:hypothetical protein